MESLASPPLAVAGFLFLSGIGGVLLARLYADVRPSVPVAGLFVSIVPMMVLLSLSQTVQPAPLMWLLVLNTGLVAIAVIDHSSRTIPDILVLPLTLAGLGRAYLVGGPWLAHLAWLIAIIALAFIWDRTIGRGRQSLGAGDVLLAGAALAWFGPALVLDILVTAAILLLAQTAIRFALGVTQREIPLAPAFYVACMAAWFGIRLL